MRLALILGLFSCSEEVTELQGRLSYPAWVDFGGVAIGTGEGQEIDFINGSSRDLFFTGWKLSAPVTVSDLPEFLRPGASFKAYVNLAPLEIGELDGALAFDAAEERHSIRLTATAHFPLMIEPSVFDLGTVPIGETEELDFGIVDFGADNLNLWSSVTGPFELIGPAQTVIEKFQTEVMTLRFTPETPGEARGEVTISVCEAPGCSMTFPITGRGVAPLICEPGSFAIDATVGGVGRAVVTCRNDTFAVVPIDALSLDSAPEGLTIEADTPALLERGDSLDIVLQYAPRIADAGRTFTGSVLAESMPTFALPFQVTSSLPGCELEVAAGLDFGHVPIPTVGTRLLRLTNSGPDPCVIEDPALTAGGFRFVDPIEATLAPGSHDFLIEFVPSSYWVETATLTFRASDEQRDHIVLLSGTGASAHIFVHPRVLSFGEVEVGCTATDTTVVHLPTDGSGSLALGTYLVPGSSEAFEVLSSQVDVPVGGKAEVAVRFRPDALGPHSGTLAVVLGATRFFVTLRGIGSSDGMNQERFEARSAPLDLLFMVDDSTSTFEEQMMLAASFEAMIGSAMDYQLAVVNADLCSCENWTTPERPIGVGLLQGQCGYFADGNLDVLVPEWRIVTPNEQPSAEEAFMQLVTLGTLGCGNETGLASFQRALSSPNVLGWNAGFLRRDADLGIVFMSDEPEQSTFAVDFYRDWLHGLKGYDQRNRTWAAAIVGDAPSGCVGPGGGAGDGSRYIEMAERSSGHFTSICSADWSAELMSSVGYLVSGLRNRVFLEHRPDPNTIVVEAGGAPVNATYEWSTNSVTVPSFLVGAVDVSVRYRSYCE